MKALKKLIEAIFQIANDLRAIRRMIEERDSPIIVKGNYKPFPKDKNVC